ncbi:hypothetical protein CFBP6109_00211 [Pseudomonas syringae pv. cerasicola]|nr:hypothetical protein CFBP6109_00211 [Pseudomonas syringae pv. cerasicola]
MTMDRLNNPEKSDADADADADALMTIRRA